MEEIEFVSNVSKYRSARRLRDDQGPGAVSGAAPARQKALLGAWHRRGGGRPCGRHISKGGGQRGLSVRLSGSIV